MDYPRVKFGYNREKDLWNLKIGLELTSKGRRPDRELSEIIQRYGQKPTEENLQDYLNLRWQDKKPIIDLVIKQLPEYWDAIEEKFFIHLADRMQLDSYFGVSELQGFFSSRYGCGYNPGENYFAVSLHNGTLQNTCVTMHEIMHIFFHKQWWKLCQEQDVLEKNIWDIKEATTVLLNSWFKNQLIDYDWGHEEHTELRKLIQKSFLESHDFKKTLLIACDYAKTNQEKSPSWI